MNAVTTSVLPPRPVTPAPANSPTYNLALGYLRAYITVLVVAHHAALAYISFAPPVPASFIAQPQWWRAFPIVDSRRWQGFDLLVGFNDIFFMSLMFFLSGLFVWSSLERKGTAKYLRDRLLRLGVPFLAAIALVAPLAYYPSYLQIAKGGGFWRQWLALGEWPSGPAWFVWVLLAFGCIAALLFRLMPTALKSTGRWLGELSSRPGRFFWLLIALSALAYIPMELAFNSLSWWSFGPFVFQTSRILHYLLYFLIATCLGVWGTNRGLLATDGKLARRWLLWVFAALGAFVLATAITIVAISTPNPPRGIETLGSLGFVLSCAASSFAFLAIFLRFARTRVAVLESLRDNAYGIYLLHYAFVSWLQYAMLRAALPALAKGSIVFLGAVALSWAVSAALRRVPVVARLI